MISSVRFPIVRIRIVFSRRFRQHFVNSASKWLNRRGGTRRRFIWSVFTHALAKVDIEKPRITELSDSRRMST